MKEKAGTVSRGERGARRDEGVERRFWELGEGYTPGVLGSSVRKRLKRKEMGKKADTSVRKRMKRKEVGSFSGG